MALYLAGVQGNTYIIAPPVFGITMHLALLSTFNALNKIVSKGNIEYTEIKPEITI